MTNRNRAWRRRQRFLTKVNETRDWVNEKFERTADAMRGMARQPAKISFKAQHHLAKRAQELREGWRSDQELREGWE